MVDWRVRKGSTTESFSEGRVLQKGGAGLLDLSICLLAGGHASPRMLGLLNPLAAASTSEGIRKDTGIVSWLHWPDLVTIDGRVVAKTSLSLAASPESVGKSVRGGKTRAMVDVSVNCFSSRPTAFPSALPSTSILEVLGVEIDVALLREKVLHALDWYYAEWERGMHRKLAERMRPTIAWLGREVVVRAAGSPPMRGRAKGLDDFGSLLLEQEGKEGRKMTRTIRPGSAELVQVVQ
jgi:biotin-(acetyl-CoA carboxylase) ligase